MLEFFKTTIAANFNFWIYVIIMMIGLWAAIGKNNLIKKLIGLSIFQTAILLLYVSMAVKEGASIPIVGEELGEAALAAKASQAAEAAAPVINPDLFANPLPHVLMLTAIVVGVATLGVALALVQMIYRDFGTLEEDAILDQIKESIEQPRKE